MTQFYVKYKIKINPNMCILMYFKNSKSQSRITRNALKSQTFGLFDKSFSGHN